MFHMGSLHCNTNRAKMQKKKKGCEGGESLIYMAAEPWGSISRMNRPGYKSSIHEGQDKSFPCIQFK